MRHWPKVRPMAQKSQYIWDTFVGKFVATTFHKITQSGHTTKTFALALTAKSLSSRVEKIRKRNFVALGIV